MSLAVKPPCQARQHAAARAGEDSRGKKSCSSRWLKGRRKWGRGGRKADSSEQIDEGWSLSGATVFVGCLLLPGRLLLYPCQEGFLPQPALGWASPWVVIYGLARESCVHGGHQLRRLSYLHFYLASLQSQWWSWASLPSSSYPSQHQQVKSFVSFARPVFSPPLQIVRNIRHWKQIAWSPIEDCPELGLDLRIPEDGDSAAFPASLFECSALLPLSVAPRNFSAPQHELWGFQGLGTLMAQGLSLFILWELIPPHPHLCSAKSVLCIFGTPGARSEQC